MDWMVALYVVVEDVERVCKGVVCWICLLFDLI